MPIVALLKDLVGPNCGSERHSGQLLLKTSSQGHFEVRRYELTVQRRFILWILSLWVVELRRKLDMQVQILCNFQLLFKYS